MRRPERSGWVPPTTPVFRKRGVEFVDGSAPGFAAIVGAARIPKRPN